MKSTIRHLWFIAICLFPSDGAADPLKSAVTRAFDAYYIANKRSFCGVVGKAAHAYRLLNTRGRLCGLGAATLGSAVEVRPMYNITSCSQDVDTLERHTCSVTIWHSCRDLNGTHVSPMCKRVADFEFVATLYTDAHGRILAHRVENWRLLRRGELDSPVERLARVAERDVVRDDLRSGQMDIRAEIRGDA